MSLSLRDKVQAWSWTFEKEVPNFDPRAPD
jgi:hypothetical protein